MSKQNNIRKKILNQPSYWVEGINSDLYNAIINYMEENDLNRTQLSKYLGVSKGRVSQILNDGEINFSIGKLVEIVLKVGKFPVFDLKDKERYFSEEAEKPLSFNQELSSNEFYSYDSEKNTAKVLPISENSQTCLSITYRKYG